MRTKENLSLRNLGDEYMVIDPSSGIVDMTRVYMLNATAAWLWKQVENIDFTEETIAGLLQKEYQISEKIALIDSRKLIEEFIKLGLVTGVDESVD